MADIPLEAKYFKARNVAVLGLQACGLTDSLIRRGLGLRKVRPLNHAVWAEFWLNLFCTKEGVPFLGETDPEAHRRAEFTDIWDAFISRRQQEWSRAWMQREGSGYPGEDIHRAVTRCMAKARELNLPCIPQLVPWNWEEQREATLGEVTHKFLTLLQEQDNQLVTLRDELKAGANEPSAPVEVPDFKFMFLLEERFSHEEARQFLQTRVARAPGVAGEMKEAQEVALKALILLENGCSQGIGVKELGYSGVESEEELLAAGVSSHLFIRYQKVEFAHRMKAPPPGVFPPLPLQYLTLKDELRGIHGVTVYSSQAAPAVAIAVENGCSVCRFSPLVL